MCKLDFLAALMLRLLRDVAVVALQTSIDYPALRHRYELLESVEREHADLLGTIRRGMAVKPAQRQNE